MEKGLYGFPHPALNTGIVNVKDYGVKGDGISNDDALIQAVINKFPAGTTFYFPSGTYKLAAKIQLTKQVQITGQFPLFKPTTNTQVFEVTSTGSYTKFSFLKFQGEGKDTASRTSQYGVYINGAGYTETFGCQFTGFPGAGFGYTNTQTNGTLGGTITACTFNANKVGIESLSRGEYFCITGCNASSNDVGIRQAGGNNLIDTCNFNYCLVGLDIITGTNNAHGVMNACNFNHCTTAGIRTDGYSQGQTFSNCHSYQSPMIIGGGTNQTLGTFFENCVFDCSSYTFNLATNVVFKNCQFDTQYVTTVTVTSSEVAYFNCFHIDGRRAYDPKTFNKEYAKYHQAGTFQTTNATQSTAVSIPLGTNHAGNWEVKIVAKNTANNDAWVAKKIAVTNMTAAASGAIVGAVADIFAPIASAGMAACAATLDVNSDALRLRVTGIAATTINWDFEVSPLVN